MLKVDWKDQSTVFLNFDANLLKFRQWKHSMEPISVPAKEYANEMHNHKVLIHKIIMELP